MLDASTDAPEPQTHPVPEYGFDQRIPCAVLRM
jgi:hypothetical protein